MREQKGAFIKLPSLLSLPSPRSSRPMCGRFLRLRFRCSWSPGRPSSSGKLSGKPSALSLEPCELGRHFRRKGVRGFFLRFCQVIYGFCGALVLLFKLFGRTLPPLPSPLHFLVNGCYAFV